VPVTQVIFPEQRQPITTNQYVRGQERARRLHSFLSDTSDTQRTQNPGSKSSSAASLTGSVYGLPPPYEQTATTKGINGATQDRSHTTLSFTEIHYNFKRRTNGSEADKLKIALQNARVGKRK
jgi:hypothetical protein